MGLVRRIALSVVLATSVALLSPSAASADNVLIAATVLPGTRTITTATLTPLSDVLRTATVSGTLAVTVTEAAVSGIAAWSVTTRLCGPNSLGTAPDCTAKGDQLLLSTDTTKTIAGTNLSVSGRSVLQSFGGGTSTAVAGSEDLSTTRTIFSNALQDPLSLYTGTYASTSTVSLTPPATATAGAYTGYLVVTLVS